MPDNTLINEPRETQLLKAIMLLDCAVPYFQRAAASEKAAYGGGTLRQITHQERLNAVQELIRDVGPAVGYEP